jgi:hypothetical protein
MARNNRDLDHYVSRLPKLYYDFYNIEKIVENHGYVNSVQYTVENYSELLLITGQSLYDFAQVLNSQGTPWLPGSLGGSYYPSGLYYWDGAKWANDKDGIYQGIENLTIGLANHTHVKADITDFDEADYATAAQGDKADSAVQPESLAYVAISGDYDDLINKPTDPGGGGGGLTLSTDPENYAVLGTDGGLYVPTPGSVGDSASLQLQWLYISGANNPGLNYFQLDTSDLSQVSFIYLNPISYPNKDVGNLLSVLIQGDRIYLQQGNKPTAYLNADITGEVIFNGTFYTIPVTPYDNGVPMDVNSFGDFLIFHSGESGGSGGGGIDTLPVTDYRSSFEADYFVYSGFILNFVPVIKRTKDNVEQVAQNVTDLETDWDNRLLLTYTNI